MESRRKTIYQKRTRERISKIGTSDKEDHREKAELLNEA